MNCTPQCIHTLLSLPPTFLFAVDPNRYAGIVMCPILPFSLLELKFADTLLGFLVLFNLRIAIHLHALMSITYSV